MNINISTLKLGDSGAEAAEIKVSLMGRIFYFNACIKRGSEFEDWATALNDVAAYLKGDYECN